MSSSRLTQTMRVLQYIKDFGSITRADALIDLGIANLPAVINILRKRGYSIETMDLQGINRYGQKVMYASYIFGIDYKEEDYESQVYVG